MTEDTLLALIIMGFGSLITLFCVGLVQYKNIVLKKEQIKADAMIKAEEIKARNQLELEKLLHDDQLKAKRSSNGSHIEESEDTRVVREKYNA